MVIFDKVIHYMMRAEIYMMGFRRTTIIGVDMALERRGIKGALTYSHKQAIMILYKTSTVCIYRIPYNENIDFVDYIYDELEPWNWN